MGCGSSGVESAGQSPTRRYDSFHFRYGGKPWTLSHRTTTPCTILGYISSNILLVIKESQTPISVELTIVLGQGASVPRDHPRFWQ